MDMNVDRGTVENEIIPQDAILNTLFGCCDSEATGLVKVSKIIEYLRLAIAKDNVEFPCNFDDLSLLLDPEGEDPEVDFVTFRKEMEYWIDGIKCQNYNAETQMSSSFKGCSDRTEEWAVLGHCENQVGRSMNMSSESVEGVGGESPQKQDWELVHKIEDLQLNNKRLLDHNAELSFQMENTEETNAQLLQELDMLRKQLRSYQNMDEKHRLIEKENEELRQTVVELQETSKMFQNKAKQLEKDRIALNEFQEELQTKLSAAHGRLESLSNDHRSVCIAYNEEKQKLIELEELQGAKEEIAKESTDTREYLTNVISELSAQKEALQMERNKMEAELFQVREDLNRLMLRNASTLSPDKQSLYVTPCKSISCVASLQQEIQQLSCGDCLPSPLVGCSTFLDETCDSDVFDSSFQSNAKNIQLSLSPLHSSLASSSYSPKSHELLSAVTQVAVDFREKKEKALQAISELVQLDKSRETKELREDLQSELEKELEFFGEKIWLLSLARKASEKRVSKLLVSLKILKEENKQLQDERDKALQKIGNLSLGSDNLETRVEELTSELKEALEKAEMLEKRCVDLQNEVNGAKDELKRVKQENEQSSVDVQSNFEKEAEKKLQELEKTNQDLKKEHEITLAKLQNLEREYERMSMDLAVEKKRAFDLQESLSLSVSKHKQELQDIMESIPNVTYADSMNKHSTSDVKSSAITGYQVRTKLREFLANEHLTIRDSPDGKPTNHEDEVPLGVSTPKEGSDMNLHSRQPFPNELGDISQSLSSDQPRFSSSPIPTGDVKISSVESSRSCDQSRNSSGSRKGRYDSDRLVSDISPNLIQPFEKEDNSVLSPNLVNPFEGKRRKNVTFTKMNNVKEPLNADERKHSDLTTQSSGNRECSENTSNALDSTSDNCAKNLVKDFSGEATQNVSASLSSSEYSEDSDETNNNNEYQSPAISPIIPQRFREISKIKRNRRTRVTNPPSIVLPDDKLQGLKLDNESATVADYCENHEEKLVFSFDGVNIESGGAETLDSPKVNSRLTSSSGETESGLENYDSEFRSSPNVVNSYIEGVSLNSNLPSDEKELEKLFKSVSLAFRTDKETLPQRLEYQERARDTAENNVVKSLECLSCGLKGLEKTADSNNNKQILKESLNSLCLQISVLKESSRRVSSQSHQFGCYQQEARMMSGVDVLINYGENISRRFETLSESLSAKEAQEDLESRLSSSRDSKKSTGNSERDQSCRRGSAFYNFVSSMRAKDGFSWFASEESPKTVTTTDESVAAKFPGELGESSQQIDQLLGEKAAETFDTVQKRVSKKRSCFNNCLCWFVRVLLILIVLVVFSFIAVKYSVIDSDFVFKQLHRNLKRFEAKYYGQEPAV